MAYANGGQNSINTDSDKICAVGGFFRACFQMAVSDLIKASSTNIPNGFTIQIPTKGVYESHGLGEPRINLSTARVIDGDEEFINEIHLYKNM